MPTDHESLLIAGGGSADFARFSRRGPSCRTAYVGTDVRSTPPKDQRLRQMNPPWLEESITAAAWHQHAPARSDSRVFGAGMGNGVCTGLYEYTPFVPDLPAHLIRRCITLRISHEQHETALHSLPLNPTWSGRSLSGIPIFW